MAVRAWFRKAYKLLPDEELMMRVGRHDDEKAFDELYRRHARRLQGFFFRMLGGDGTRAADFMQETFLRVWAARGRYEAGRGFSPWMFTLAYNLCRNEYRRLDAMSVGAEWDEGCEAGYETQEELRMDTEDFDRALRAELQRLPFDRRVLFALRFEEELTVPQVAAVLGVPEGTVKSRLHYLLQHLRQKLKAYERL